MKKLVLIPFLALPVFLLLAASKKTNPAVSVLTVPTTQYPGQVLSDTPRMKQYWLVQLFRGSSRSHDQATSQRIQAAHLANIDRLWKEGKVVMAGPMGYKYDADWRGIFIMDVPDSATAAAYIKTDSAVITGRLRFELHPWWTQTGTYTFK